MRKELTDININWNNKYYKLYKPIIIRAKYEIPETIYKYLYIRKLDADIPNVDDVDFYLQPKQYQKLKQSVLLKKFTKG